MKSPLLVSQFLELPLNEVRACKDCSDPVELGVLCDSCEHKLLSYFEASLDEILQQAASPKLPWLPDSQNITITDIVAQGYQTLWQVRIKFANLPKGIFKEVTSMMRQRSLMPMSAKSTLFHNASTGTLTAYCEEPQAKALQMALSMMGLKADLHPFTLRAKG